MPKRRRVISHRDFARDLGRGALGEDIAEAFFQKQLGLEAENVSEKNPDYDMAISRLSSPGKLSEGAQKRAFRKAIKKTFGYTGKDRITVEVKFDEAAARYKNLFIEIFFDIETGSPGTTFKCKADILAWIIPARKKFKIYLLKRPEFLAWVFQYMFTNKKIKYKTPGISPYARGIAVPIDLIAASYACVGEFEYKL